ncbi:hypothetical protein HXX76_013809 [Chlamydomonas incerta]|uniref:Uncharacterized protein n=1 Tax=Chlamydomonas incerta TaxID=51695 RepID=A0A835VRR8_CHLIN|nr:hypothetical protein HXX76_013809 [Chlamydomonas incerta]|eukprot:KAG2425395.1 hypothetical protein HXX76_013809 [Chlamydomonas incerta]
MRRPQKKRRQAPAGRANGTDAGPQPETPPGPPRPWAELPPEIVAMIALATCDVLEPLPFICIPDPAGDASLAYHRHEDRTFGVSRGQFGAAPEVESAPVGAAGASGHAGTASAAAAGPEELPEPMGPPGTFRPARMSAAAAAMRCACRAWCELLGEGVRRLVVPPPQSSVTLWPSHFSHVSHLALGGCDDVAVVLRPPPAFQHPEEGEAAEEEGEQEGEAGPEAQGSVTGAAAGKRRRAGEAGPAPSPPAPMAGQAGSDPAAGLGGSGSGAAGAAGSAGAADAGAPAAVPPRRRSTRVATLAPAGGPGGASAAAGSRSAPQGGGGPRGRGAAAAGKSGAGPQSAAEAGPSGAAAGASAAAAAAAARPLSSVPTGRTLAPLGHLRNLQVSDSTPHLDLAASAGPRLEELVVIARQPVLARGRGWAGRHDHDSDWDDDDHVMGGGDDGGMKPRKNQPRGGAGKAGRGGKAAAPELARRSALGITLSALPGLRRLRLSGVDASAARLGSALMGLSGLSSLRLMNCALPTFFGTSGGEDGEEDGDGGYAAAMAVMFGMAGGRGRGGRAGGRGGRGRGQRGGGGATGGSGGGRRGGGKAGASPFGLALLQNLGGKLQDLSLQGCQLGTLPAEVLAGLPLLRHLDLSANFLAVLPPSLTSLRLLEYLDLQGNDLVALPSGFGAGLCRRLADLDLSRNGLTNLPPDFSRLTGLSYLSLGSNLELAWSAVAPHLAALTGLHSLCMEELYMFGDHMDDPPPPPPAAAAGGFPQPARPPSPLEQLVALVSPAAAAAATSIGGGGGCCRLRELVLNSCGTAALPASFSQLTALSYLSLNCNFLGPEDGDSVAALEPLRGLAGSLAVLRLSYLDLDGSLPGVLWGLTGLRELALEQNFIEVLSPEISRLTNLQVLNLADVFSPTTQHPRTAMPWRSVYRLTKLRELKVSGFDKAPSLPLGIGALHQLEVLMLNSFPMSYAVLEELASSCGRLCGLELRRACIKTLPPAFTRLERLTELDLEHNSLKALPPGLCAGLGRLNELALAANTQLVTLPAEVTALTRLTRFTWSVRCKSTREPSAAQLAWLAGVRSLTLSGAWDHTAVAGQYGIKTTAQMPRQPCRMRVV